jgi:radical SAM superfamily enzyme YgiQ (UPF0313 family)
MKVIKNKFLPTTREEVFQRGWDAVDVILVTGDAYVDHPSFGIALIGAAGWRLTATGWRSSLNPATIPPRISNALARSAPFFRYFGGKPRFHCGQLYRQCEGERPGRLFPGRQSLFGEEKVKVAKRRPDRATLIYSNLARAAYGNVPVILGGIEASLRRFVHFDYQQAKLRTSLALTDAKADLLVFGMGERAVLEIARRLELGEDLTGIPGTCERLSDKEREARTFDEPPLVLESWDVLRTDVSRFMTVELGGRQPCQGASRVPLLLAPAGHVGASEPAGGTLECDKNWMRSTLFPLPVPRTPSAGDVPAYRMIRHSVTIVRGCSGNCSFCAIARHQARR